ncbi:MAG TPA: hypothetical protein VGM64_02880 [Lacunisphaera sp.]|jgi:hypothetical protein
MSAARPRAERNPGFLFADISRLARLEFDRRVRDLGLTRAQRTIWDLDLRADCLRDEYLEGFPRRIAGYF